MNRREFVKGAVVGAATLAMPSFIERAFAAGRSNEDAARELAEAHGRAQRMHVPLLVWIVPRSRPRNERAEAFGALLNHGSDEVLAELALAEVACAPIDVLSRRVRMSKRREPLMILVEGDSTRPEIHPLDGRLVDRRLTRRRATPDNAYEARIDRYIETLSELIHRGLARSPEMVAARASCVADGATRARVRRAAERASVTLEIAALAPAVVADVARTNENRAMLVATLAELTRERLVRGRVPGSAWATTDGCGVAIEGEPTGAGVVPVADYLPVFLDCGMGHVPERARRFLSFYVD